MTFKLSKDNYYELLALHRALLESKFNNEPNDFDVSKSPIVNRIYSDVIDTLLEAELERDGEAGKNRWLSWLQMDRTKREWKISLNTIKRERSWPEWESEKKKDFVVTVIFPFQISNESLEEFILEANSMFEN